MRTILNYSPNFDSQKRKLKNIKFIVFHYTGMKNENDAIKKLTSEKSKVSSHYFIKNNGEILSLVPDVYISWHSGVSSWKKYNFINKYSIGIEISNKGHDFKYKNFNKKQINSVIKLSKFLIKKYKIRSNFILGHSDISPDRKKDPGEKFPWHYLYKKNIGIWHNLNQEYISTKRNIKLNKKDEITFIENLFKIGYPKNNNISKKKYTKLITKAFQRRFRQELINGIIDLECLLICKNLIKNINNIS